MFNRGMLFLLSAVVFSCHRDSPGTKGEGSIKAVDVEAPVGLDGPAVLQCDRDGKDCSPVAKNDGIGDGRLIKSERGAGAVFELGAATSLEIGEQAAVYLASSSAIEVTHGYVVVRRLGSADKSEPFRIELAGRTAEIDPKVDGTVIVRAKTAERATVTVEKGKLSLRSGGGQTAVLLSGETVDLTRGKPPERIASFVAVEPHFATSTPPMMVAEAEPRGLGRMTARVPGRTDVVSGVRLVSHSIDVVLRDGLARTEVEEVFHNDTAQVLEGRYVFPLPADASISRLALWVNDKPVEGEIVEKKRAAAIFKGIVDDTVRPRDPALLEWVSGGDFSLKIFPLPAKGSRKVRIAYDQVLKESGGRTRYVYPLSVGAERATQIEDFSLQVRATDTRARLEEVETPRYATTKSGDERSFRIAWGAKQFVPASDFVVSYTRARDDDDAEVSAYVPSWGELRGGGLDHAARGAEGAGYFTLRVRADLPFGMTPSHVRRDRAIVIDTSHSQSRETLEGEARLAAGIARQVDADERFVVLACDSACVSFPDSGLAAATAENLARLGEWLSTRAPTGSSDVAGALIDAVRRLDPSGAGQVVYIGDGAPTSGELSAAAMAAHLRPMLAAPQLDLRFLGTGRTVDEVVIGSLAQTLGATYEPVMTGESIEQRIAELSLSLRSPVIRGAAVDLPSTFSDVYPKTLPNLSLGQQIVLVGRLAASEPGEVKLRGELEGQPYALTRAVRWTAEAARQNPLTPRLWSLARIADLESSSDSSAVKQVIDLSKRYHVMSRYTSLLVLENDQMFAELGIPRTAPPPSGLPADDLALGATGQAPGGGGLSAEEGSFGAGHAGPRPSAVAQSAVADKFATDDMSSGAQPASPAATAAPSPPAPAAAPMRAAANKGAEPTIESEESRRRQMDSPPMAAPEPKTEMARPDARSSSGSIAGSEWALDATSGRPASQGRVEMGAPQVNGSMAAEVIRRVFTRSLGRMNLCYESGLRRNPSLAGRIAVRFVIGQGGDVLSSMDGGSTVADPTVVSCVVATVRAIAFPRPDAGFVTVVVPLNFWAGALAASPSVPAEPTATHRAADDGWRSKGEEALAKLRLAVETNSTSRRKYEDLVRGLLARGRFEEALTTAKRFVEMDPDLSVARELLAYAAAANDDGSLAASAIDTQTETDPASVKWHVRGARSFEALGDERRACAHWRSLAQLAPRSDEFAFESWRCRARVLDERDAVLAEARGAGKKGKLISELIEQVEASRPPPFSKAAAGAGQFEAEVTCSGGDRCPFVFVVSPNGTVFSPFTPTDSRSSARSVAFAGLRDGTYMTALTGGSPDSRGELSLRTLGSTKKFPIVHGGRQTVAATRVTFPSATQSPLWRPMGEGFLKVPHEWLPR